jgi:hypothetical protein
MSALFNAIRVAGDDAYYREMFGLSAFLGMDGYEPLEGQQGWQILPGIALGNYSGQKSSSLARLDRSQSNNDRITDTTLFIDTLGMCSAVDPVEFYWGEFVYAPIAVGVGGIANAGGTGTGAAGGLFIGRKMSEYAGFAVGAEISSFNVASSPFTFDAGVPRATFNWGNGVQTHRERLNFLATQAGIPLNQFWLPFNPVKYPQRADSVLDGTGAASDPRGIPDLNRINVMDWYRHDLPLPSDFQHGLIVTGQGRFLNDTAIEISRAQRNEDWVGGQWRNGIVFRNNTSFGDSVLDTLITATGNPANVTIGGQTPVLRALDFRNVRAALELFSVDTFRVGGDGNVVTGGSIFLQQPNGIWFQQPPMHPEHDFPQPNGNQFPAIRTKTNMFVFSFNANFHYVINGNNSTAQFRAGTFASL